MAENLAISPGSTDAGATTSASMFFTLLRHPPACPGDPFSFFEKENWLARMKRAMTVN
jgi:hypothetical protein